MAQRSRGVSFFQLFCVYPLVLALGGCAASNPPRPIPLANAKTPLITPTYDGSGQSVEPDVAFFASAWRGYQYWMAYSPYPNGNARDENPSILASNDGLNWSIPSGVSNPLALPSAGDLELADASIFYDSSSDQLWVYYLDVFASSMNLLRLSSSDGVIWNNDGVLFTTPGQEILSPTVTKVGDTYYLWTVNGGTAGCYTKTTATVEYRTSTDGVNWSVPQATDMAQNGYSIWHINITPIPSKQEYWAAIAAFPVGLNCASTVLFFSRSPDGVHWTSYGRIALDRGGTWDRDQIYRSVFLYDPSSDQLSVWYSARGGEIWHIGLTQGNYSDFIAWLQQ